MFRVFFYKSNQIFYLLTMMMFRVLQVDGCFQYYEKFYELIFINVGSKY